MQLLYEPQDGKRHPLQQSLLHHRNQPHSSPAHIQRHHLMTSPSTTVTLTPNNLSSNTHASNGLPSSRQSTMVVQGGGSGGKIGGFFVNRKDSISLPPSPTRSMLIKKETLLQSSNGDAVG